MFACFITFIELAVFLDLDCLFYSFTKSFSSSPLFFLFFTLFLICSHIQHYLVHDTRNNPSKQLDLQTPINQSINQLTPPFQSLLPTHPPTYPSRPATQHKQTSGCILYNTKYVCICMHACTHHPSPYDTSKPKESLGKGKEK